MSAPALLPRPRRVGSRTDAVLPPQGYRLVVDGVGPAQIDAADAAGRFYAEQTLAQLGPSPAPVVIEDWPDIAIRGVMLDVSRDKVPTIATLEALIDRLAAMKINQLQLYIEHTFAYDGHDDVWATASPFTADEIRHLDAYCHARHVELTPNQNCLGHMERWLAFPRYKPLAIAPGGWVDPRGRTRPPTTLDPSKPASLGFVRELLHQLLPNFTSRRVHVGLDEPWELPDERFAEYLDYIHRLRGAQELDGRDMLIWGDIVARHPEQASSLPRATTVCEWGYEADHPFDARAAGLAAAGIAFWLCPGTSSWNSIAGRWTNMRDNCAGAARAAVAHGASGYLVTDWGDNGHLQYLPVSDAGFAQAAAVSWCAEANEDIDLEAVLSAHVFRDDTGELAAAFHDLGDVHRAVTPQMPNTSVLLLPLLVPRLRMQEGLTAGASIDELDHAREVIARARARVSRARSQRTDAPLIASEVETAADLLDLLVTDMRARLDAGGSLDGVSGLIRGELAARLSGVRERHRELWLERNRPGGLDDSCARLDRLVETYTGESGK